MIVDWITNNLTDVLAVLGALYLVALFVVKLTPTPRDDEALKEVSGLLRAVAKVFGLDLKQGREKKLKPKRPDGEILGIVLVGSMLLLPGCASAGDQYQASSFAFVAAVDAATELRKAGKLTEAEVLAIGAAIDQGNKTLNLWAEALKAEKDYPDGTAVVASSVSVIREYLVKARARPAPTDPAARPHIVTGCAVDHGTGGHTASCFKHADGLCWCGKKGE